MRDPERGGRAQALALLRSEAGRFSVSEVAERLGLHPNSARLHLEQLVGAGLAVRETRRRAGRGRPNVVYAAVGFPALGPSGATADDGDSGYRLLAEILAGHLASTAPRPVEEAAAAGRSWGRLLAGRRGDRAARDEGRPTVGEATGELVGLLDRLGFAPRAGEPAESIELHRCPFGQVAERHSPVVCAVHLGLMQGALGERDAPIEAAGLEPFVTPGMCLARLRARSGDVSGRPGSPGGH